jgi:hypothetical protein
VTAADKLQQYLSYRRTGSDAYRHEFAKDVEAFRDALWKALAAHYAGKR